jgi:hypothetical protein
MSAMPPAQAPGPGPGPKPTGRAGMPTVAKVLLFAVAPIVLALVLVITVISAVLAPTTSTTQQFDLDAGSGLSVAVRNATLDFVESDDNRVHVEVSGFSWGRSDPVTGDDSGAIPEISGGCRGGLFTICRMNLDVALPADLPLTVRGTNGRITATGLTGNLQLHTSNGAIDVTDSAGELNLGTTNGAITVEDGGSSAVYAETTNGQIDLECDSAPRTVEAESTNGAISIRVPNDGQEYRVEASTVNGRVETGSVPEDSDSFRTLSARTTNGAVTMEAAD